MSRDNLGPFFKCYPEAFLGGLAGLSAPQMGYYTFCVMWIYNEGDAVYLTPAELGRYCRGNKASADRIVAELIAAEKLIKLPDGGLINERALFEMIAQVATPSRKIPRVVKARIGYLFGQYERAASHDVSDKLSESYRKVIENLSKTSAKNSIKSKAPFKTLDGRGKTLDKKINQKRFLELYPAAAPAAASLGAAIVNQHGPAAWESWLGPNAAEIDGLEIFARSNFKRTRLAERFGGLIAEHGLTLSRKIRPAPPEPASQGEAQGEQQTQPQTETLA